MRPSFEKAKLLYVHRYTLEHVPQWAANTKRGLQNGNFGYYAPRFRSDEEWYEHSLFPGEPGRPKGWPEHDVYNDPKHYTWPLGTMLNAPYQTNRPKNAKKEVPCKEDFTNACDETIPNITASGEKTAESSESTSADVKNGLTTSEKEGN